jgi:activating signal cointegrator 1
MKALSIWQPWASLIAMGTKRVETRSWGTPYRGLVAIHAASRKEGLVKLLIETNLTLDTFGQLPLSGRIPLGAVVAVAELVACVESRGHDDGRFRALEHELGDLSRGRWAWCFKDVQSVYPGISVRGQQGLWNLPLGVEDKVLAMTRAEPIPTTTVPTHTQRTLF